MLVVGTSFLAETALNCNSHVFLHTVWNSVLVNWDNLKSFSKTKHQFTKCFTKLASRQVCVNFLK